MRWPWRSGRSRFLLGRSGGSRCSLGRSVDRGARPDGALAGLRRPCTSRQTPLPAMDVGHISGHGRCAGRRERMKMSRLRNVPGAAGTSRVGRVPAPRYISATVAWILHHQALRRKHFRFSAAEALICTRRPARTGLGELRTRGTLSPTPDPRPPTPDRRPPTADRRQAAVRVARNTSAWCVQGEITASARRPGAIGPRGAPRFAWPASRQRP